MPSSVRLRELVSSVARSEAHRDLVLDLRCGVRVVLGKLRHLSRGGLHPVVEIQR